MKGIQLLLTLDFGGHVTAKRDKLLHGPRGIAERCDAQVEILRAGALQAGGYNPAGGCVLKERKVRAENLRRAESLEKGPATTVATTPLLESGVCPKDALV